MIVVIFEVWPAPGKKSEYLERAAALRNELVQMEGFIGIERFASLADDEKLLSVSFWRDEAAVQRWRNLESHRDAQGRGREGLFKDYRIRVAQVVRDYSLSEREQAPDDSRSAHG